MQNRLATAGVASAVTAAGANVAPVTSPTITSPATTAVGGTLFLLTSRKCEPSIAGATAGAAPTAPVCTDP